jgi:signal transduction histidine kinase/putative methionine-R-sulfoxide reductase with GAF domain
MKDSIASPISRLSRIYCALAAGAAVLITVCFYINFKYLSRSNALLNWIGLLLLAWAILYGFKIARQASLDAHKNAQLLQETKQRTMEIAALYDTLQHVSEKQELRALLQIILEKATTLLAAAGCAIFLYDKEQNDFEIAVEVGVGMPIGTHLPANQGLAGRVAETLEPVIVNDYPSWPYRSKALQQLPIRATVCVPMIRGGELVGVLGVHEVGGTNREFTEADARLLSLFADNAAGAVHTARLLDALQSSEERFRIAAQCATDIVYDWDLLRDHVDYFGALFEKSRAANTRLAATRKEYWSLIHPDDRARVEQVLKNHFETGSPFSEEYRIAAGQGTYVNVADRATAIRNQRGTPVRLIGGLSDITERKYAEQMKSDFVSFVTHQLRTPLSGMKWMLELAADSMSDPEEARSYIQDARMSTDRLIGMVNDLLDISRLERGKLQLTFHNLDVVQITQSIIDEISHLAVEKEQSLTTEITPEVPPVYGDAQLLRQAILNLISNAIKYTPSGGKIHVRIERDDTQVLWSVKDTGIGIPKADVAKLFEKFYRAGNVLAVETEGTGLGLYLVRLIADRFGGKVRCESTEGAGSKFLLALPIAT